MVETATFRVITILNLEYPRNAIRSDKNSFRIVPMTAAYLKTISNYNNNCYKP